MLFLKNKKVFRDKMVFRPNIEIFKNQTTISIISSNKTQSKYLKQIVFYNNINI